MREARIENRLKQRTGQAGGMCIKMVVLSTAGLPDRLVLLPGGRVMFVELKAPGEVPKPIQVYMHGKIKALGFDVHTVDSLEKVDALFT